MSDNRDDPNLDWLYRRDEDERTSVTPPDPSPPAAPGGGSAPRSTGPIYAESPASGYAEQSSGYPKPTSGYPDPRAHGAGRPSQPRPDHPGAQQTPSPAAKPATRTKAPTTKPRRPVLRTVGLILAAWLLFMIGTPVYALFSIGRVDSTSASPLANQPGTTVLLVGSDSRDDLSLEERKRLGTGHIEGQRTDTMMLLHQPKQGQPVLLSLPRDSLVDIPGHNQNRLNASFAFGGAPLLVETVEANTGIQIDGYLEIGFAGVVDLIDAVGGVEVCPEKAIKDKDSHLDIPAGCQTLDGVTGLGYVRMRKADARGDLGRVERQREVIGQITKRAVSPLTLLNPVSYWRLNMAAAHTLRRGEDTSVLELGNMGLGFVAVTRGAGLSMTVPVADANHNAAGVGSTILWDEAAAQKIFDAIASGDTTGLE
ncbi:LCP family protein [Tessaracoccus caeni]|uniref:LCP family protein n=1 Tax=Tessaracoccus caeni TaxID=3031239 RepID=UPI0023DC676C|nr:LCP family protein [Tessaracoccus caeni]MDF1488913.1 LCP family protein [Tessaracoccus caeni]